MLPIYGECTRYKMNQLQILQNQQIDRYTSRTDLYSMYLVPKTELTKVKRIICVHKLTHELSKNNFKLVTNEDVVHGR